MRRHPARRLRSRALALPDVKTDGAFTDCRRSGVRLLEWAVPADADGDKPDVVKQANPASWITTEALAGQRPAIPDMAFRRYHCNQWGSGEGAWLRPCAWQKCVGEPACADGVPIVVAAGDRQALLVAAGGIDRPNPRVEIDGVRALIVLDRLEDRPADVRLRGWL